MNWLTTGDRVLRIILICVAIGCTSVYAQSPTPEELQLYYIAKNARDPEFCFPLVNPDYQMYCRVVVRDIGASCDQITSDTVRAACVKKLQSNQ